MTANIFYMLKSADMRFRYVSFVALFIGKAIQSLKFLIYITRWFGYSSFALS